MNSSGQAFPRDATRLTGKIAPSDPGVPADVMKHPAMKAAGKSWHSLHADKFAKNAGRFGKKKKQPQQSHT